MARDPKMELSRMKRSLRDWLKFRTMNSAAGLSAAEASERAQVESQLLAKMKALLYDVHGSGVILPDDAPAVATMIIYDQVPVGSPQAQGILPFVIVVGAIALVLMMGISSYADYARDREKYECIEKYGAWQCDTSGQLWKWGVIAGIGYLAWTKFGVRELAGRLGGGRKR